MLYAIVSQTFLFHRPIFILDMLFRSPNLIKQTQGGKFKDF